MICIWCSSRPKLSVSLVHYAFAKVISIAAILIGLCFPASLNELYKRGVFGGVHLLPRCLRWHC
jgi:hypothetical protein